MAKLTIVANIHARPEKIDFVKAELEKLLPIMLTEEGCLQYDMHQNNEDPAHFLFFENWTTREHWQKHLKAPHLVAYMAATEGAIDTFTLHEMTQVD
ncbi:MAG: putative quinol monooxygenase [Acidobacteriota bacterium]